MKAAFISILLFFISANNLFFAYASDSSKQVARDLKKENKTALSRQKMIGQTLDEWEKKHVEKYEPSFSDSPFSEEKKIKMKGYYKMINLASKDYTQDDYYQSTQQRLRLDFDFKLNDIYSSKITWDNNWITGDILNTADFKAAKDVGSGTFFDVDKRVLNDADLFWATSLYRGYLKYDKKPFVVVLGRQRISWSVARLWETVDFFNPVAPLSIEPHERTGVDAVDLEWKIKGSTRLEGVYAPESNYKKSSFAGKFSTLLGNYDISLLGGKFKEDRAVAVTFDGYLSSGGLRGEVSYVFSNDGDDFKRFDAGYDYTFSNGLYTLIEYLYNGNALGESLAGDLTVRNQVATKNKHLIGNQLGYDLTPLLRVENITIYDPEETSVFVMPTLEYSLLTNVDLLAGAQLFLGSSDSEFGAYHNIYYTWLQWYF